jgi:SAM-dependent methyltransferase
MIHDRGTFESSYAGRAPWDIGRPQKAFIDTAERISGSVLDAGCGTGDTALLFAGRGCQVTGIDFIEEAINWTERFDQVIDSGLLTDEDRLRYVDAVRHRLTRMWRSRPCCSRRACQSIWRFGRTRTSRGRRRCRRRAG